MLLCFFLGSIWSMIIWFFSFIIAAAWCRTNFTWNFFWDTIQFEQRHKKKQRTQNKEFQLNSSKISSKKKSNNKTKKKNININEWTKRTNNKWTDWVLMSSQSRIKCMWISVSVTLCLSHTLYIKTIFVNELGTYRMWSTWFNCYVATELSGIYSLWLYVNTHTTTTLLTHVMIGSCYDSFR